MSIETAVPEQTDQEAHDLQARLKCEFLSHSRWRALPVDNIAHTDKGTALSESLVQRAIDAYTLSAGSAHGDGSMWSDMFRQHHTAAHVKLLQKDVKGVTAIWENPARGYPFWGFDDIHETYTAQREHSPDGQAVAAYRVYDNLLQLGAACGVTRLEYPEAAPTPPENDVELLLDRLDAAIGFYIDFPNPYPLEFGLRTRRGIASYRAIQALYQAFRTKTLIGNSRTARVVEIGAGLGRAAYYCFKTGIRDYTIIDLPFTNISQAIHLGTILGETAIDLKGEAKPASITIAAPDDLGTSHYDLVVNFDSLTEMDGSSQRSYMKWIRSNADGFLSVNHEFNPTTVRSLISEFLPDWKTTRNLYWMRRGYVEEIAVKQ